MSASSESLPTVGAGKHRYRPTPDWQRLPDGWSYPEVAGIATDSRGRLFVFNRSEHPLIVLNPDGSFVASLAEKLFNRPHGVHIGPDDAVYCTDDNGHVVRKLTPDGELLMTFGTGQPSDTDIVDGDYRSLTRCGPPFNLPTNVALGAEGDLFITDGYGNARVHHFAPDGTLLHSWGEPGAGPGQFNLPHGIAVAPDGMVFVADRENSRLQLFTPQGEFVAEWTDIARPCQVFVDAEGTVYVAELGWTAGMYSGNTPPSPDATGGRVSIFTREGELLARWGGGSDPCGPADFFAPHDIWVDGAGNLFVGEVTWSAGGRLGLVPAGCPSLRRYERVSDAA